MPELDLNDVPEGFSDKALALYEVLTTVMHETSKVAEADGVPEEQIVSAIMSATMTELVNLIDRPYTVVGILREGADALAATLKETCTCGDTTH